MNIYRILASADGEVEFNCVVVADNDEEAAKLIHYDTILSVELIGISIDNNSRIVAEESW